MSTSNIMHNIIAILLLVAGWPLYIPPAGRPPPTTRAVNQLIDYQELIAILIDYFNYQFNYLKPTSISISISS
jgi:hypothetical protein